MSSAQRIIKALADILALWLTVIIVSGIATVGLAFVSIGTIKESVENVSDEMSTVEITQDITKIEIDISSASVYVKVADSFSCQTNDNGFRITQKKGKLKIEEKNLKILSGFGDSVIVITVPQSVILESFEADSDSGSLYIESVNCREFDIDSGIGDTSIENINVIEKADIDGDIGDIEIKNGTVNNLKLSLGMGSADLSVKLTGLNDIEAGVEELDLNVLSFVDDYTVHVETGIGKISVAGEVFTDNRTIGSGSNIINIEGGVGSVNVSFNAA